MVHPNPNSAWTCGKARSSERNRVRNDRRPSVFPTRLGWILRNPDVRVVFRRPEPLRSARFQAMIGYPRHSPNDSGDGPALTVCASNWINYALIPGVIAPTSTNCARGFQIQSIDGTKLASVHGIYPHDTLSGFLTNTTIRDQPCRIPASIFFHSAGARRSCT